MQGLVQNKVQQTPRVHAAQPLSAIQPTAWHAGGQRFESAWLHYVRLLAPQGFFLLHGKLLAGPAGPKSAKSIAPNGSGSEWLDCSGEGARDGIGVVLQLTDPHQQLREARELTAQHP